MAQSEAGLKRKRPGDKNQVEARKRARKPAKSRVAVDKVAELEELEKDIGDDPLNNHHNVESLLHMIDVENPDATKNLKVAVSLCKIFSRLIAAGNLERGSNGTTGKSTQNVAEQYMRHYKSYQNAVVNLLRSVSASQQLPILHLCWKIIEQDAELWESAVWESSNLFPSLLSALIETPGGKEVRETFVSEYMSQCHDCCYHALGPLSSSVSSTQDGKVVEAVIEILLALDLPPSSAEDLNLLVEPSKTPSKKALITPTSLKRRAEQVWLSILRSPHLNPTTRKHLLRMSSSKILPWISRPEILMDFLTDSYDIGGSTSLLALSGLFYLITTKNLDYPAFYPKLYSLLDADLLQSKHRSRFLRLLSTFLASSRLPATLIASFIKRLSRRALFAPPAAIVATIPFIYNLLKAHPSCTFMLHRQSPSQPQPTTFKTVKSPLSQDPFDMSQPDPQHTGAIGSSLWELETLQSHYHPNVASLARIISEQFTKQRYGLEDFLDHGYGSMLESELAKEAKKEPVVEWRIPKRILLVDDHDDHDEGSQRDTRVGVVPEERSLVTRLWQF